jgi:hypothetical protein
MPMKLIRPDYTNSIVNVTNSILAYYQAKTHHPTHKMLDQYLNDTKPNHIIYMLLDGLGMNVLTHHLPPSATLRKYVMTPITSVYPPTTVAATTAVIAGKTPLETGHIGWVQYFKEEDTNLVVFQNKDFYTGEEQTENLKQKYLSFPTFYEQINAFSPDIITKEFFPSFREGGSETFAEEIDKVLLSTHNTDASFNYVYWVEPDLTEHQFGTYSNEVGTLMKQLNEDFTMLLDNITDDTAVILIADHGLVDVKQLPLFEYEDVTSLLSQKPSVEPRTTTFFVQPGQQELFKERFNHHFQDYYDLLTKEEFLTCGLLGAGTKHPILDQCLGDFVALAKSEYMFSLHEGKGYKAHHAGSSEEEMMVPLIIYPKK